MLASIIAGIANSTMNAVTTCAQTKIGTRLSDIPGARILRAVTMISTDTASAATSVKVISCAHTSARLPGVILRTGERHIGEPADVRARCSARTW